MSQAIGVGIIGCGFRVRILAKPLCERFPSIRVVALSDPNPESIRAAQEIAHGQAKVYEDYRALCDDPNVDWVLVGSWNALHCEHVIAALAAGKHVFCEKPLATSVSDTAKIKAAVDESQRIFSFGLTLRYAALYQRIHALLESGAIGTLVSLEFSMNLDFNHGGFIHMDWRRHTRFAGTHMLEKCCHDLDLANLFARSVVRRVASFGGTNFFVPENAFHIERIGPDALGNPAYASWLGLNRGGAYAPHPFTTDKDVVDNQVAILEYANQVRAAFHTNCNAAFPERRLLLCGTDGALRADLVQGMLEHRRIGWNEPTVIYREAGGGHGDGDHYLVGNLAGSMLEGRAPAAGIREAVTSTITALAIDRAHQTGQVVDADELWRELGITMP